MAEGTDGAGGGGGGGSMDPMMMGLLAGLGKAWLVDAPKEKRQRLLAAQTQLYSPWTGLQAQPVQEADPFGSSLQGVTAGAMYKQGQQADQNAKDELAMKKDYYSAMKGAQNPSLGGNVMAPGQPSMMDPSMQFQSGLPRRNPWGQMSY